MKFKITIEERVCQGFDVEASSMEEAMEIAEAKYNSGEFVLEPGIVTLKQMMGECKATGEATEWTEF